MRIEFPKKLAFLFQPHAFKVAYGGREGTKCLALGTQVIMADGSLRRVEDVKVGECVMGPDSTPRAVLSLASGAGPLYRVHQTSGIDYVVNESHILSLKKSESSKKDLRIMASGNPRSPNGRYPSWPAITNIDVLTYAAQSKRWRAHFRGYRAGLIRMPYKQVAIDPYFLGLWLGDGTGRELRITTEDPEIIEYCRGHAESVGGEISIGGKAGNRAKDIGIQAKSGRKNLLWEPFKAYGLKDNKHIPQDYLANAESIRLELLAGLLDTDGHYRKDKRCFVIVQVNERLAKEIKYLADALGFRTSLVRYKTICTNNGVKGIAWRVSIGGAVWRIPCRIPRKQANKADFKTVKDKLISEVQVERIEDGPWAGFTVDGDHLFLLEDGTVTHNSWGFAGALLEIGTGGLLLYPGPKRILCVRETQTSIAASVHQLLQDTIKRMSIEHLYEVQETTIRGKNGTEFIFAGLKHNVNNIKSLEGADIVWVEEAQTVSKDSWDTLLPTIRKEGAEIWVSFNPKLATDDTYKRWVLNPPPGAVVVKIGWEDNRWLSGISKARIEHMRLTSPRDFDHIYGGECLSEVEGAIFGQEYKQALADGRIGSVPYNKSKPVITIWDLGFGDPTAIWFVQAYDGWYNFIDYLESTDETTADYVIKLQNKGYMYDTDWLPHDGVDTIIHGRLNGTGDRSKSIEQLLRDARRNVRIVPKLLVTDQINAARLFWNQCRFDSVKCADGLQSLAHYQWDIREAKPEEMDPRAGKEDNQVRKGKAPLHNWASHASSAFQGAAIAVKQPKNPPAPKPEYHDAGIGFGWG